MNWRHSVLKKASRGALALSNLLVLLGDGRKQVFRVRVSLAAFKPDGRTANHYGDDDSEEYHFLVFSLIYIRLAACVYDAAFANCCHGDLS